MKKILYAVVFLIMAVTLDLVWRKVADFAFSYEFTDGLTAYSYHNFSKKTDVLVIGASRARYHINTDLIQDSLHIGCFNLAMDACGLYQQYASLKRCYENGPISTVILELSPMQMGHPINKEFTNITYFTPYYWKDSELKDVMDRAYGRRYTLRYLCSFVQYNGLFFDIAVRLKNRHTNVVSNNTGYVSFPENNYEHTGLEEKLDFTLHPICLEILENIVNLCKSNGSRLVIVISPVLRDWSCYTDWLGSYCEKNYIEFYDYSGKSNLSNDRLFRDAGHMNYIGADMFTRCLIEDLKLSYGNR